MVSRAKKAGPNLKLLASHQTIRSLGNRCRKIWSIIKQIWYIPFIWSLTWYSYWILREVVVLNTPLIQVNPMNYLGAFISISVLLVATPRLGTKIRKVFHVGVRIKNNDKSTSFSYAKQSVRDIQEEKLKPHKLQVNLQNSIEKSGIEKPEQPTQKLIRPHSDANALSSSESYSNHYNIGQKVSPECLTCANLINCKFRREESGEPQAKGHESIKCPFAAELSDNKTNPS